MPLKENLIAGDHPDFFDFRLVSPEKVLFSGKVRLVIVPGIAGDFGILAAHTPLVSRIRPGLVRIEQRDTEPSLLYVYVASGFVHVTPTESVILTQECAFLNELNPVSLEAVIRTKNEELLAARSEERREILQQDLYLANLKLQLVVKNQHFF